MIACFNVIGLFHVDLDKKDDVVTLRSLGASDKLISRIFLFEGRLISLFGAISGIVLGLILCFIQQKFGIISLGGGGGTFVVDAYPVSVHALGYGTYFYHRFGSWIPFCMVSCTLSK